MRISSLGALAQQVIESGLASKWSLVERALKNAQRSLQKIGIDIQEYVPKNVRDFSSEDLKILKQNLAEKLKKDAEAVTLEQRAAMTPQERFTFANALRIKNSAFEALILQLEAILTFNSELKPYELSEAEWAAALQTRVDWEEQIIPVSEALEQQALELDLPVVFQGMEHQPKL